jgi:hypothetical protein
MHKKKRSVKGIESSREDSRKILLLIPSGPDDFSTFRDLRTASVSDEFRKILPRIVEVDDGPKSGIFVLECSI